MASSASWACGAKRYCKDMINCAEATYYLPVCGLKRLDRDGDGIPCEKICGKTAAVHKRRVLAQTGGASLKSMFATASVGLAAQPGPSPLLAQAKAFSCAVKKRYCRDFDSCAEAKFYLTQCGLKRLDGDGDGIPCNSLCR